MQVHVVRSGHAGCEPLCLQWIAAQGRIVPGTAAQLRKVLRQLGERKLPVFIDSGGGAVNDALAIGRLMRAKGLYVVVTRTAFTPCAPKDAACRKAKTSGELRGLAQAYMSKCASSCAFILAGGTNRLVGPGTGVGVHQVSMTLRRYQVWTRRSFGTPVETKKTLLSVQKVGQKHAEARSTYANIWKYLAEMGISGELASLIMATPNDQIHWLTPDELHRTRLATDFMNGEQIIAGIATSTPVFTPRPATLPEIMGYQSICEKYGACHEDLPAGSLKLDQPGYVVVPPPSSHPQRRRNKPPLCTLTSAPGAPIVDDLPLPRQAKRCRSSALLIILPATFFWTACQIIQPRPLACGRAQHQPRTPDGRAYARPCRPASGSAGLRQGSRSRPPWRWAPFSRRLRRRLPPMNPERPHGSYPRSSSDG
jgi:hypothetical protein